MRRVEFGPSGNFRLKKESRNLPGVIRVFLGIVWIREKFQRILFPEEPRTDRKQHANNPLLRHDATRWWMISLTPERGIDLSEDHRDKRSRLATRYSSDVIKRASPRTRVDPRCSFCSLPKLSNVLPVDGYRRCFTGYRILGIFKSILDRSSY